MVAMERRSMWHGCHEKAQEIVLCMSKQVTWSQWGVEKCMSFKCSWSTFGSPLKAFYPGLTKKPLAIGNYSMPPLCLAAVSDRYKTFVAHSKNSQWQGTEYGEILQVGLVNEAFKMSGLVNYPTCWFPQN